MALTDTAVRNTKPKAEPYKIADSSGLYLLVMPNGSRLWRFDYRFASKRRTLSLGKYPITGLADARRARDSARELLENNIDPSEKRKLDKLAVTIAASNTFKAIAEEWLARTEREGRSPRTIEKNRWLLELVYGAIGSRPVSAITAQELLLALRKIEMRGRYETARRSRSICGRVFRYAIATGRAERDPSIDLAGALIVPKQKHHAAITEPTEIAGLLRAIDGYSGSPIVLAALKLLSLTFVRPGELRFAEWKEFDFDEMRWTIPAPRMKTRVPHIVPLSTQSLAILNYLKRLTGDGHLLFPSIRSAARPISENTLNGALRRLSYKTDEMTSHGFRSMASTRLNEMGTWNPDAIERQLAHGERNSIRAAYNYAQHLKERTGMMQAWADYLTELKSRRI